VSVILPAGIGVLLIVVLFFLLKWRFPAAGRPIAAILGVLALAAYAPYAITHWPGADVVAMVVSLLVITAFMLGLISPPTAEKKMTFHWGPAAIIAFFAVIILLDSIFLTLATRGLSENAASELLPKPDEGTTVTSFFPGTVARNYQRKEQEFNRYNKTINAQITRGWQVRKGWMQGAVANKPTPFRVEVQDKNGKPVSGATILIKFMRPSDKRQDFTAKIDEIKPGIYQSKVKMPEPGLWEVVIRIHRGEEMHEIRAQTDVNPASS